MEIRVALFGRCKDFATDNEILVRIEEGATVRTMVDLLVGQYGLGFRHSVLRDDGHVWPEVAILINGTNITLGQGLTTQLEEGDTVAIIPVITGGSSGLPLSQNG